MVEVGRWEETIALVWERWMGCSLQLYFLGSPDLSIFVLIICVCVCVCVLIYVFLIGDDCFVILCWFLPYINMNPP